MARLGRAYPARAHTQRQSVTPSNALAPSGKVVSVVIGSAAVLRGPIGVVISVAIGAPSVGAPRVVAAGKVVSVIAGTVTLVTPVPIFDEAGGAWLDEANQIIYAEGTDRQVATPTGKTIAVTIGTPTVTLGAAQLHPSGKIVSVVAGAALLTPGSVSRPATGKIVSVVIGTATLHATRTITATGKVVNVTAGTATVILGGPSIHPSGLIVHVAIGSARTVSVNTAYATVTRAGDYSATVSVG